MKKLLSALTISLILAGCGQDTTTTSSNTASSSSSQTSSSTRTVAKTGNYEWKWLAGVDATNVDEESLYKKNYYFVLDGSGSMGNSPGSCNRNESKNKIDIAKQAIQDFVATIPSDANVGLFAFDDSGINERAQLATSNREHFNQKLEQVTATSSTPLHTAISKAYEKVKLQAIQQAAHGEYNIIVLTDGEADGGEDPRNIVRNISNDSPVNLYTIGFCIGEGHSLNDPDYVNYYKANDATSIIAGLSEVLAESDEEL